MGSLEGSGMLTVHSEARVDSPTSLQQSSRNPKPKLSRRPWDVNPGMYPTLIGDTGETLQLTVEQLVPHITVKELGWDLTEKADLPVGGRMRMFLHNWQLVTRDPTILAAIRGYQLDFVRDPPTQNRPIPALNFGPDRAALVDAEVQSLLEKKAIVETSPDKIRFWSQIFLREKKGGGYRPVFNLKELNKYIRYEHFKMDNIAMLPSLIQRNDWMIKTDIKDAYLSVPITPDHQTYLGFQWNQKSFMFCTCPFGMSSAPRLYTKLLKPAVAMMRKMGMRVIIYLDDCLIMNQDKERILRDRDTALFIF
jgi:hypothetical protein